jgi:hypothetical protein
VHEDVTPTQVSRTNKFGSTAELLFGAILVAQDTKATNRPTASTAGVRLLPLLTPPTDGTEARIVLGAHPAESAVKQVLRTNASPKPLAPPTIFVAPEAKATNSSPELIEGELPLAAVPSVAIATDVVPGMQPEGAPLQVSRRKTQLLSPPQIDVPGRIFVACESKATKRPSPLIEESRLWPFVGAPS